MNWNAKSFATCVLKLTCLLSIATLTRAQNSVTVAQAPNAVIVLDSTKAQDGLNGSVRRVKTEFAKLELKNGQIVEGPRQLIELTTYDISGKRSENISYPVTSSSPGKEEYKYDDRGNIVEMTTRGDGGEILSKETYDYEFDRFGNWTKMVTSLVVFESEQVKHEPIEVTYRSLTYYFGDSVAKIAGSPSHEATAASLPASNQFGSNEVVVGASQSTIVSSSAPEPIGGLHSAPPANVGNPPSPEIKKSAPVPEVVPGASANESNGALSDEPKDKATPASRTAFISAVGDKELHDSLDASQPASKNTASPVSALGNSGLTGRAETASTVTASIAATNEKRAFDLYKTGRDLFDSGDVKAAIVAYRQSIELAPTSAAVQLSLGQAYLNLKKDKDASKAFKESVRLNADSTEAYYGLGLASFRMGRFKDAADAFKKAVQINPSLGKAHYGLALAFQELGDVTGVIDEYRTLQKLDRDLAKQLARAFPVFDLPCHAGSSCK